MPPNPTPPEPADDPTTLDVRSDISAVDGTYQVGFSYGPDLAWTLPTRAATAYAVACFAAATTVEHDAAVLRMLTSRIGLPISESGQFLHHVVRAPRRDQPPTSGPLQLRTGVTLAGKPFFTMHLHGDPVAQMSPDEVRGHASHVLGAIAAVDLDAHLHHCLTTGMDLPDNSARGFIATLAEHWPPTSWPETGPSR